MDKPIATVQLLTTDTKQYALILTSKTTIKTGDQIDYDQQQCFCMISELLQSKD